MVPWLMVSEKYNDDVVHGNCKKEWYRGLWYVKNDDDVVPGN